jgi:hypothetical protein
MKLLITLALLLSAPVAHATPCDVWWISNGSLVCETDPAPADPQAASACASVAARLTCDLTSEPECAYQQADMFDACMTVAGSAPGTVRDDF